MTEIIYWALAAIGAAYIVGKSEISFPIRKALVTIGGPLIWVVQMLECPVCFGFWLGLACAWWFNPLSFGSNPAIWTALVTAGMNLLTARFAGMTVPMEGHE